MIIILKFVLLIIHIKKTIDMELNRKGLWTAEWNSTA